LKEVILERLTKGLVVVKRIFFGCELIGRWHAPGNIGVLIIEANDVVSINKYMMQWDDLVDVSVTPVMDDAGALKSMES
jgi:hypothetical protein